MEELDLETRRGRNTREQSHRPGDTSATYKAWKWDSKEAFEDVRHPSLCHHVGNTCLTYRMNVPEVISVPLLPPQGWLLLGTGQGCAG